MTKSGRRCWRPCAPPGIRNYNIFRHGLTLFGYFETDDLEATKAALRQSGRQALGRMDGADHEDRDRPQTQFPYLLPKQFFME